MHTRTDLATAAQIDLAINLAATHGAHAAAAGLRQQGIALELAVRVLLKPWLRRNATSTMPVGATIGHGDQQWNRNEHRS
ncbi:hypothetical protein [Massilia timonae]|uniref:hypothetical protein n=1 Tax=Massilia timonae TaxID=47229 RepID=UPI00115FEEF8|nr:hypothetical protein [Massilia timonae]